MNLHFVINLHIVIPSRPVEPPAFLASCPTPCSAPDKSIFIQLQPVDYPRYPLNSTKKIIPKSTLRPPQPTSVFQPFSVTRMLNCPAMKMPIPFLAAALAVVSLLHTAAAPVFKEQTIDDKIGIGYGLAVADV